MQTVKMKYSRDYMFRDIHDLYTRISSPQEKKSLVPTCYDIGFRNLFDILDKHVPWFERPRLINRVYNYPNYTTGKFRIICVSGGKDSTAVIEWYKHNKPDMHLILYHLHGINKVYHDEYTAAQEIAKYYGLYCKIDECQVTGTHDFIEHPMKNYIIANGAIDFALDKGLPPNLAFGNFSQSKLDDMEFNVCGGDSPEMWNAYKKIMGRRCPGVSIELPLRTQADTYWYLDNNPKVIRETMSCISPYRFRDYWQKRTETNYGIKLLPHRCGCCWKCAVEYITYVDKHVEGFEFDEEYYLHCLEILGKTMQKESDVAIISVQDVWDNYISYDISYSRVREKIQYAFIQNGKIRGLEEITGR